MNNKYECKFECQCGECDHFNPPAPSMTTPPEALQDDFSKAYTKNADGFYVRNRDYRDDPMLTESQPERDKAEALQDETPWRERHNQLEAEYHDWEKSEKQSGKPWSQIGPFSEWVYRRLDKAEAELAAARSERDDWMQQASLGGVRTQFICTANPKDHHTIYGGFFGTPDLPKDGTYWCDVHMRHWLTEQLSAARSESTRLREALQKVRSHVLLACEPFSRNSGNMIVATERVYGAFEYIDAALSESPCTKEGK